MRMSSLCLRHSWRYHNTGNILETSYEDQMDVDEDYNCRDGEIEELALNDLTLDDWIEAHSTHGTDGDNNAVDVAESYPGLGARPGY